MLLERFSFPGLGADVATAASSAASSASPGAASKAISTPPPTLCTGPLSKRDARPLSTLSVTPAQHAPCICLYVKTP